MKIFQSLRLNLENQVNLIFLAVLVFCVSPLNSYCTMTARIAMALKKNLPQRTYKKSQETKAHTEKVKSIPFSHA